MKIGKLTLLMSLFLLFSCSNQKSEENRIPLLEVEGKFLYEDQVKDIIPPNLSAKDSSMIAESFIRKWITDVLLYENAKRNVTDKAEIDRLLEEYRKSLTIQQYQQKLISQRLPKEPSEEEMKKFYDEYQEQFKLKENLVQGLLIVLPKGAPKLGNIRSWIQNPNSKNLSEIEKYSIQNALSFDFFADRWIPLSDVLRKLPLQIANPESFASTTRFLETQDSTRQFLLRITRFKLVGETEPFESAKDKISSLILNKLKSDFISGIEDELYKDAVKDGTVNYIKKKK